MTELLRIEATVVSVPKPAIVVGDIHGQFYDLQHLLTLVGGGVFTNNCNYVFLGDYVDRGRYSIEVIELLYCLKLKYPKRITLIRGNHESESVSRQYGFYQECMDRYKTSSVWKWFCSSFNYLSLAAVVDGSVFCVHGGLSPQISTIDEIQLIDRVQDIPEGEAFTDLLWSDPDDTPFDESKSGWGVSTRGAGKTFNEKVVKQFNYTNNLELICRSHQLVQDGYKYQFSDASLVTVWSAPNYCGRCGNKAAVLTLYEGGNRRLSIFPEAVRPQKFEPQPPSDK